MHIRYGMDLDLDEMQFDEMNEMSFSGRKMDREYPSCRNPKGLPLVFGIEMEFLYVKVPSTQMEQCSKLFCSPLLCIS